MSIVEVRELEFHLGAGDNRRYQSLLTQAEALIASRGVGVLTLEKRAVVDTIRLPISSTYLLINEGPMTALTEVQVDGEVRDTAELFDIWTVADYEEAFPRNVPIQVTYTSGYDNTDLPETLRAAILLQAQRLNIAGEGRILQAESLGDHSQTWSVPSTTEGAVSMDALKMAAAYRRNWREMY